MTLPISFFTKFSNFVLLNDGSFLNKKTGLASSNIDPELELEINEDIFVVTGVDEQKIDLGLISNGNGLDSSKGFLVEVYVSGSDGRLQRLYKEDNIDLNGDILDEGFDKYFSLELDKE